MLIRSDESNSSLKSKLKQVNDLFLIIQNYFEKDKSMADILKNILENDNFECYLTEIYDIHSICKLIGCLTMKDAQKLFQSEKYHRFAFALLAESIMRSCKIKLKESKLNENEFIQNIIGLSIDTDLDKYKFDMDRAIRKSGSFYKNKLTNCSPYAVCACLGLLEIYHNKEVLDLDHIESAFLTKQISMKNFLTNHIVADGLTTQVALYLQGLRYNKANKRYEIKFDNPEKIIKDITNEQIRLIKQKQELMRSLKDKQNLRYYNRMEKLQPYHEYHEGLPKIFTPEDIDKLNSTNDTYELMPNGLLKHHCCYQKCPYYLVNMSTENDKTSKKRHGIMKHLDANQWLNNYIKGFHRLATNLARKTQSSNEFVSLMDDKFKSDPVYRAKITDQMKHNLWNSYK